MVKRKLNFWLLRAQHSGQCLTHNLMFMRRNSILEQDSFYVIRWMTYCEGAILSLAHSLTHSVVIRCVTAGKAVRAPFNFPGFPRAKHNFLDRLRPNITLLETLFMGYFKSRVEHLCDVNKKTNGGWSSACTRCC